MTLRRQRIWFALFVAACVAFGLWLRVRQLSAEGFADDEVHKWLAANRYLHGDFGGDDVEHPMLMKWLIAASIALFGRFGLAPEALTRLPNALVGGLTVWLVALLGRRLYGTFAGALAAALAAVSPTLIGYQRVAKEDTLVAAFLVLMLWCLAEGAVARDRRRWEVGTALSLAGLLASKYYVFFAPLPVLVWLALRRDAGWEIPARRWLQLCGIAAAAWLAVNWTPLMPGTWAYLADHLAGRHVATPSLYFMGHLYTNVPGKLATGLPPWFYFVFAAAKLTPAVLLCAAAGIALSLFRGTALHRVTLVWAAFWFAVWMFSGAKYGRYFVSVLPAFLLFAAYAISRLRRPLPVAALLAAVAVTGEAHAALSLGPHERLYVSPLLGGEKNLDWLFPHCDYFDAGFREAVRDVAAQAEPGASISSEIDLPASYYASDRPDLHVTLLRPGAACAPDEPCYVIVQPGRRYLHNAKVLEDLSRCEPWLVERVAGHAAATVYRLEPGDSPFVAATAESRLTPWGVLVPAKYWPGDSCCRSESAPAASPRCTPRRTASVAAKSR